MLQQVNLQMNSLWAFRGTDGDRARAVSPPLGAIYGHVSLRKWSQSWEDILSWDLQQYLAIERKGPAEVQKSGPRQALPPSKRKGR